MGHVLDYFSVKEYGAKNDLMWYILFLMNGQFSPVVLLFVVIYPKLQWNFSLKLIDIGFSEHVPFVWIFLLLSNHSSVLILRPSQLSCFMISMKTLRSFHIDENSSCAKQGSYFVPYLRHLRYFLRNFLIFKSVSRSCSTKNLLFNYK